MTGFFPPFTLQDIPVLTLGNSPFKTPFEPRPLEEESAQMYHQRDLTDTDSLEAFLFDSSTGHAVSPTGVKKEDDSSMTLESTMPFSYAAASNTSSLTAEDHHQHPWDLFTSFDASDLFSSPNGDASSSSTSLSVEGGNHLAAPSLPEGQGQQLQPPPAPRLVPSYNGSSTLLSKSQIPDTSPFSLSLSAHQNHYHPSSPRTNGANWDAFDLFSSNDGSSLGLLNVFDDSRSTSAQQLSHFDLDSTRGTRFDVDPTLIYCPFVSKTEPEEGEYSSRMRPEALQKGVSSLIAASSASASLSSTTFGQDRLSMIVADYEANPDRECTILILHAKVVQKSYGSEKRFMTPQPMVYLLGPIWNKDYAQVSVSLHGSPSATALPTNNANHASKRLRLDSQPVSVPSPNLQSQWAETIGSESGPIALLSQTSHLSDSNASRTETPTTYVKSLFKSLFVNDTEKARGVVLRVSVGLTLPGAQVKVDVESKEVRIISKPSKKKVAAKTMELCVVSGSKIALFNRVKSQTVSTRYLAVSDSSSSSSPLLGGKPHEWDAFVIWAVDDPRRPSTSQLVPSSGLLTSQALHGQALLPDNAGGTTDRSDHCKTPLIYGQKVVLQSARTGVTTRPVVFCKLADRNWAEIRFHSGAEGVTGGGNTSQISQLHRVALLLPENQEFMSLCNDSVTTLPPVSGGSILRGGVLTQGLFEVDEMSIWTLCSVDQTEYTFHVPHHLGLSLYPMHSLPRVDEVTIDNGSRMLLRGVRLRSSLSVFFGHTAAIALEWRSSQLLIVAVPKFEDSDRERRQILLVDSDGVVYRTGYAVWL